jgi:PilZ domain
MPEDRPVTDFALERRSRFRYFLELNVRYHTVSAARPLVGIGHTLNVSSSGLLIASAGQILEDGVRLRVSIEWPFPLDGATPLQLFAECRVIRRQPSGFAVRSTTTSSARNPAATTRTPRSPIRLHAVPFLRKLN